jgi:hypothetical protein
MKTPAIVSELEMIRNRAGGVLKPNDVVDFASDPSTALHAQFEWDDSEAAREYRLHQARNLIRVMVTVLPNTVKETRAYVSLVSDRSTDGGYRTMVDVLSDDDRRAELLKMALTDMRRWRDKYGELKELAAIFEAIDELEGQAA